MKALHLKRQRAGLDAGEPQELEVLVRMFERKMLIRAHAMLLVTQRGLDIASRVPGA